MLGLVVGKHDDLLLPMTMGMMMVADGTLRLASSCCVFKLLVVDEMMSSFEFAPASD